MISPAGTQKTRYNEAMRKRYCTVPNILGLRQWFEERFGDLCYQHDSDYLTQTGTRKEADRKMYEGMKAKGYPVLGAITYYGFLRPLGWLYWDDVIK
jgi:hypothetical protein